MDYKKENSLIHHVNSPNYSNIFQNDSSIERINDSVSNEHLSDLDGLITKKVNQGIKQAMTIVIKKLDGLVNHKLSLLTKQQDNEKFRHQMEARLDTMEQRIVR